MKYDKEKVQYEINTKCAQVGRRRADSIFTIGSKSYTENRILPSGVTGSVRIFQSSEDGSEYIVKSLLPGYFHILENERRLFAKANNEYEAYSFTFDDCESRLVMSLLPGKTLHQQVQEMQVSTTHNRSEKIIKIFEAVIKAYIKAHARNVIHLDVKADNILIEEIDGKFVARLCDFGHSRERGNSVKKVDPSATHWAPELRTHKNQIEITSATEKMDVYSIGAMFSTIKAIPNFIDKFVKQAQSESPEERPDLKSFYCDHTQVTISVKHLEGAIQNYMIYRGWFRKNCIWIPAKTRTITNLEKLVSQCEPSGSITEKQIKAAIAPRDKCPFKSGIIRDTVGLFREVSRGLDTNINKQKLSATEKAIYDLAQSATVSTISS